ncbi:MAG: sulfatase [Verrucomicrobiota bacterium]
MKTLHGKIAGLARSGMFAMALLAAAGTARAAADKVNFILINIDDLGYADIGPYGSTSRTPNLDRMAKEGRKLTSHYAAPVCSPSRASLMTGSYPKRAMPTPGVLFPGGAVGLNPAERTVAEVLKDAGYATACVGKWHLGDQPEFLPTRQGFDFYFGLPYSNDMGPASEGVKSNFGAPLPSDTPAAKKNAKAQVDDETGKKGMGQPPLPLFKNEAVIARVRAAEQQTLIERYTDEAVGFIRAQKDKPFFLYLPHSAVHFPLYPSEKHRGKSVNGMRGDWVEELDASIGRLFDTVRELGIERKTLVIFTSDNGGPLNHEAKNTPLRGGKGQIFEGGVRVCTIAWWPGRIPAGTTTDAMTSMMDILPTFAQLAGARVPTDRKLDGVDVSSVLLGTKDAKPPRTEFFYFGGFTLQAVRSGPWKLHLASKQLFNLADDIGESKDVAAAQPAVVTRLQALAQTMEGDLGLTGVGPGCRPLGRVSNAKPAIAMDGTVRAEFAGVHKKLP